MEGFHASLADAEEGNIPGFPETTGNRCRIFNQLNVFYATNDKKTVFTANFRVISMFPMYKTSISLMCSSSAFEFYTLQYSMFLDGSILRCVQKAVDGHIDLNNLHRECSAPGRQCPPPSLLLHAS